MFIAFVSKAVVNVCRINYSFIIILQLYYIGFIKYVNIIIIVFIKIKKSYASNS